MQPKDEDAKELFVTTREAARLLGVSVRSVQLWVESGVLQAWKTAGGHRRVVRASVDELLEQQRDVIQTVTGATLLKVVVVDHDPVYLELYQLKLESWDLPAAVTTLTDGFEALLVIGKTSPHVVITDLQLPSMNALDMVRALTRCSPDIAIIATTTLSGAEIEASGGLPNTVGVLKKPLEFPVLEGLLRRKARELYGRTMPTAAPPTR